MQATSRLRPAGCGRTRRATATGWGSAHFATACALAFLGLALLVDRDAGTLSPPRTLLWPALTAMIFAILLPAARDRRPRMAGDQRPTATPRGAPTETAGRQHATAPG